MLLQGERISRDYVEEWVEVGYSFLNDKETPSIKNFTKDGGAFRYKSDHVLCKDRWMVWRVKDDTVELSELSLHVNLTGNGLRLYFPNTTVLSPIVIVEEGLAVSILISTTASVHRLVCPHPSTQMGTYNMVSTARTTSSSVLESIDTTVLQTKHHFSYIPHDVAPALATAALTQVGAAVFAFSYPSADLRLVTLPPMGTDAAVLQTDLHQWSVMQRLWSGVSRRSIMTESESTPLSLTMSQLGPDMLLFSLCKDIKLRVWSVNNKECMNVESIPSKTPLRLHGNQTLTFKPATDSSTAMLGMHCSFTDGSIFRIYTVSYSQDQLSMNLIFYSSAWDMPLKHFAITSDKILALHDESGTSRVLTLQFENTNTDNEGSWEEAQVIEPSEMDEDLYSDPEAFAEFCISEYTENTLCAALDKVGFELGDLSIEASLAAFLQTHDSMGDLEDTLPIFYSECQTFHDINSTPVSISEGMVVMSGDLSLLLPSSSDFYVEESSVLMSTFLKLTECIPVEGWELLQASDGGALTDLSRELLTTHLNPENTAELCALLLSMEDVTEVLVGAVRSIARYPAQTCQLPTLFRSATGGECLIRAVDTGVFDAHKTYAVLLVLLFYIEQEQIGLGEKTQTILRTTLIPECLQIMNRFNLLQWILSSSVDSTAEYDNFGNLNISEVDTKPRTILHHYLASRHPLVQYSGLKDIKRIVVGLINVMYPGSDMLDLPQFLLTSQYFEQLKEYYVRSECCSAALKHIAAQAFAATGEETTAVKMFISVAKNFDMSSQLLNTFIGSPDSSMPVSLQYIVKCITMLERSSLSKAIVSLATQAALFSDKEHLPLLCSLGFKHAVEAGEYDQAYKAMSANPSSSQKHACLKRFVVVLVESGQAKRLVNYPYHGFKSEVVSVLEFKARNSDLRQCSNKNYYNLLFAFHVQNKMYQHAAATAYEHVLRLQNEVPGVGSIHQQLRGYLTAISCLELLRQQDAWILEPGQIADVRVAVNASPKRPRSSDQLNKKSSTKLTLITVKELRAGYVLVDSLAKISLRKPDSVKLHNLSPSEVLGLLCSCGLYDQAFLLASYHALPPPLASLTARCINLAQHFATHSHLPSGFTEWLQHNNIPSTDELNPSDRAWLYLQTKVSGYQTWEGLKQVLSQVLSAPYPPPFWLLKLCKEANIEGTIRLCAQYDSLQLAVRLAIGYLGAVAGRETRDYGLENSLQSNLPPVYVPYTVFDQVLLQLKQKTDKSSAELYKDLVQEIHDHLELLERVSDDNEYLNRDRMAHQLIT